MSEAQREALAAHGDDVGCIYCLRRVTLICHGDGTHSVEMENRSGEPTGRRVLAPGEVVVPLKPSEEMIEAVWQRFGRSGILPEWLREDITADLRAALRAAHE